MTGNPFDFNAKQFLCDLANEAGKGTWDGTIRQDPVDIPQYPIDPTNFAGVGDPRHTTETALKMAFDTFLPRLSAYKEVLNAGGCQVIDNYVCDTEGVPLIRASSNCSANFSKVPYVAEDVINLVKQNYVNDIQNQTNLFVNYIKTNYLDLGWEAELNDLGPLHTFYIYLTKNGKTPVTIKYFYDQKDNVANQLGLPLFSYDSLASVSNAISGINFQSFMGALQTKPLVF